MIFGEPRLLPNGQPKIRAQVFQAAIARECDDGLAPMSSFQEAQSGRSIRAGGESTENAFLGGQATGAMDSLLIGDLQIAVDLASLQELQIVHRITPAL